MNPKTNEFEELLKLSKENLTELGRRIQNEIEQLEEGAMSRSNGEPTLKQMQPSYCDILEALVKTIECACDVFGDGCLAPRNKQVYEDVLMLLESMGLAKEMGLAEETGDEYYKLNWQELENMRVEENHDKLENACKIQLSNAQNAIENSNTKQGTNHTLKLAEKSKTPTQLMHLKKM